LTERTSTVGDIDALPELNAGASAKLLGIPLVAFNRLCRDGLIVPLSGRRNAYSVKAVVSGFISHLTDKHLALSPMAIHLAISPHTLTTLVEDGVIERPGPQGFPVDKTRNAYLSHLHRKIKTVAAAPVEPKRVTEQDRLVRARRLKIERENTIASGRLFDADLVEHAVTLRDTVFRDQVLALPRSVANFAARGDQVFRVVVEAYVQDLVNNVLTNLSDPRKFFALTQAAGIPWSDPDAVKTSAADDEARH
jgi:hypothetical protein